jgi:cytochrome c-type biogenesis protein CcmH/NrfG
LKLFPRSENPYRGLGSVYVLKGDYGQASKAYRNLLALAPTNVIAIEMLGLLDGASDDAMGSSK